MRSAEGGRLCVGRHKLGRSVSVAGLGRLQTDSADVLQ